jgi:hypothetical protein
MLSSRGLRIAGALLLLTLTSGLALAADREYVLRTHRHVIVKVFNVDGTVQVFVNCRQAAVITPTESGEAVDLGWLRPGDRIFLSVTSHNHSPSWGFMAIHNGTIFFKEMQGHAKVLGVRAEAHAVVFAEGFTAEGTRLGSIGCQEPGVVSVTGYLQSPDDAKVSAVLDDGPPYRPPHPIYDQIDAVGRWSLPTLAALGFATLIGIGSIRRQAWSHSGLVGGAGGALALLGTIAGFLGLLGAALLTTLTIGGIILLLAVGIVLIRRPAGAA